MTVLAGVCILWARSIKPAPEAQMVREVRDMALSDMEHELSLADAEVRALKNEIFGFVRNPLDSLLPGLIAPLISGAAKGLKARS